MTSHQPEQNSNLLSDQTIQQLTLAEVDNQLSRLLARKQHLLAHQPVEQTQSKHYPCVNPAARRVVVIGGAGKLGGLFVRLFMASEYTVSIIEADDWAHSDSLLKDAALVLVAVPIQLTLPVIQKLANLADDCVLADVTSIKESPVQQMLQVHSGSVVGLHPMFAPDVADIRGQTIVCCHGRKANDYQWLLQQLAVWQAKIVQSSAQKHDETMGIVQVLRHFSTIVYGVHLAAEQVNLEDVLAMSSPIYRLELAMVGRLFAQDPDLYTEIIFANPQNIVMMQHYIERFEQLLNLLKNTDKSEFKKAFLQTSNWFGDYAELFLQESSRMLVAAKDSQVESALESGLAAS